MGTALSLDVLKKSGYVWWIKRFQIMFELFDAIPTSITSSASLGTGAFPPTIRTAENAATGSKAGLHFSNGVPQINACSSSPEDLVWSPTMLTVLRENWRSPGMSSRSSRDRRRQSENPFSRTIMFHARSSLRTGTHDNDTTVGWFAALSVSRCAMRPSLYSQRWARSIGNSSGWYGRRRPTLAMVTRRFAGISTIRAHESARYQRRKLGVAFVAGRVD